MRKGLGINLPTSRLAVVVPALVGLVVLVVWSLAACGNEDPPPPPPPPGFTPPVPGQPVVPVQPVVPGQPAVPGQPLVPGQPVPGQPAVPVQPVVPVQETTTIALAPGFMPDPYVEAGTSGGPVDASTWDPSCRGHVAAMPNHLFNAGGSFSSLRLLVSGGAEDTTLVVQKPDGTYICDDDSSGQDPILAGHTFPQGTYKVWVGSYQEGIFAPYNLGFTELTSVNISTLGVPGATAGATTATPSPGDMRSNFGTVTLSPGFSPDLYRATGSAGGSVEALTWDPSCAGHVSEVPDHLFIAGGNFPFLKILASSPTDITLVIQRADGSFLCNDDSDGTNPAISGVFPPGPYRIWVGTYQGGQRPPYTLGLSERPSMSPGEL